jgi:holo-[acyl-carrier protein] synthase
MITGIGADIIEVGRIREALSRHPSFSSKVFTQAEEEYCRKSSDPAERFAGRFAAKEAIAKALGRSLSWRDVEILPDAHGKPTVRLARKALETAAGRTVMVTISHCREYAVGYAVVEDRAQA